MESDDYQDVDDYGEICNDFKDKLTSVIAKLYNEQESRIGKEDCWSNIAIRKRVWEKFSVKHQKSPSHVNNNIQSCSRTTRSKHNCNSQSSSDEANSKNVTKTSGKNKMDSTRLSDNCKVALENVSKLLTICFSAVKFIFFLVCFLVIFYCLIVLHKPTQAFMSRNTQDLIYPLMRTLRVATLPVVRQFSILTDFYEESCLLSNPFYAMDNLDCWPCESARHVIDLTGFSNFSSAYHHSGIPFIIKDAMKTEVGFDDLQAIYAENSELLEKVFLDSNIQGLVTFNELFGRHRKTLSQSDLHVKWKINRVTVARLLRKYFPKPYFIPVTTEVSVQHYLFIDEVRSKTYTLPLTEFANVFLTQASGSRYVVLIPTKNCHHRCKVISTVLQPKDVLFYNWLFWRPVSVHVESSYSNVSITYLGSFY